VGRIHVVARLAMRDLTRRRSEALLFLIVIMTATTTLTVGLALSGVTGQPYQTTRTATTGPDIVGVAFPGRPHAGTGADLVAMTHAKGVVAYTGPFPAAFPVLRAHGQVDAVVAEGRTTAPAAADQPKVTQGSWARPGGVVVERTFAAALGIHVGDRVTLNGRGFPVIGIAATAAVPMYPNVGFLDFGTPQYRNPGLVWLTESDAQSLATTAQPLMYLANVKLAHPDRADAFAAPYQNSPNGPLVVSWNGISGQDALQVKNNQQILLIGSSLLALLALASVAVLVGGRMADQMRRVGLLKAVGATPGFVAAVLLAEYVVVALVASAVGLVLGRQIAPALTSPGAGLLGTAGPPVLDLSSAAVVIGMALAVAVLATLVPALRAAQSSTTLALANAARPPRRNGGVIALSALLPVPLLLGIRIAVRRPRRIVLSVLSVAISVSGLVGVLIVHATNDHQTAFSGGPSDPTTAQLNKVMLIIAVMLIALALVNTIFLTRATVVDTRRSSAIARALGATPGQVTFGLSVAQIAPALVGAVLGIPGGFLLIDAVKGNAVTNAPPLWWLLAVVAATVSAVWALTALPTRLATRRPVAQVLQTEMA
jgi:ABC-type lipoprotein release transport system permease subunit